MTPVIYDFVADVANHSKYFIVPLPQGNVGSRVIDVTVIENGRPYVYPTNASYTCTGVNGAGNGVSVTCSLVDGKVRIPVSNAMISYSGIGKYRVEIMSGWDIVSSFNFHISVEEVPLEQKKIVTTEDFQQLADALSQVSNFNRWYVLEGTPSNDTGNNLDLYLNTLDQAVYQKNGNEWEYKCTLGSHMYIAYADDDEGTNFSLTYTDQSYLGICNSQALTQPVNPSLYTWIMISGGDNMKVSDYGGSDENTVAQADYIKGEKLISDIIIPANTTTPTTTVVVEDEAIGTSTVIEKVWTTKFGLNPINVTTGEGTLTLIFPALSTSATAMIKIWNVGNYLYPAPMEWNDTTIPTRETVDIDFASEFSV